MSENKFDDTLRRYLQQHLTVKKADFNKAKNEIVPVVEDIIQKVAQFDPRFEMKMEYRGSVYEKVKIKEADEFDFDLPIAALTIEEAPKKRLPGVPSEFTTYTLNPGLLETWKNLTDADGKLSSERIVAVFANLVQKAIVSINGQNKLQYRLGTVTNHPAVTVVFYKRKKEVYNVDLAPVIEIKKWPENLTKGWEDRGRKGWPTSEIINKLKSNTPVYLVPKLYKDKTHEQRNNLWRYAFNKGEKKLLLESDAGEDNSCRRNVLRILKGFLVDLKWPALRSYHMKTVLLHESETWPGSSEWKDSQIGTRVLNAVRRLQTFASLEKPKCKHYFLPDINIMQGINDQQKTQLLKKLEEFLSNPLAAVLAIMLDRVSLELAEKTKLDEAAGKL